MFSSALFVLKCETVVGSPDVIWTCLQGYVVLYTAIELGSKYTVAAAVY